MTIFRAFQELDRILEQHGDDTESKSTLTEAKIGNNDSHFANNIDKDIVDGLGLPVPEKPITNKSEKCSKSAIANALYCVSNNQDVKFVLGSIRENTKQVTHCWIEYKGRVIQTNNYYPQYKLITKYSVDLIPGNIDESKKIILDLINSINEK